jgi:hypothetical protein
MDHEGQLEAAGPVEERFEATVVVGMAAPRSISRLRSGPTSNRKT